MIATTPFAPSVVETIDRESPSMSESLPSTSIGVAPASSSMVAVSSRAIGGSFVGSTVTETVAVSVMPCPSEMV